MPQWTPQFMEDVHLLLVAVTALVAALQVWVLLRIRQK